MPGQRRETDKKRHRVSGEPIRPYIRPQKQHGLHDGIVPDINPIRIVWEFDQRLNPALGKTDAQDDPREC